MRSLLALLALLLAACPSGGDDDDSAVTDDDDSTGDDDDTTGDDDDATGDDDDATGDDDDATGDDDDATGDAEFVASGPANGTFFYIEGPTYGVNGCVVSVAPPTNYLLASLGPAINTVDSVAQTFQLLPGTGQAVCDYEFDGSFTCADIVFSVDHSLLPNPLDAVTTGTLQSWGNFEGLLLTYQGTPYDFPMRWAGTFTHQLTIQCTGTQCTPAAFSMGIMSGIFPCGTEITSVGANLSWPGAQ